MRNNQKVNGSRNTYPYLPFFAEYQRPVRGISPLKHGAQGGANLNITNGDEVDEDADGEDEVGYGERRRAVSVGHGEEDDEVLDDGGGKRRRVEVDDYDDDD